jgi:hypothetical protein
MKNRNTNLAFRVSSLVALSLTASFASASISNVTGQTTWLTSPPTACGWGQLTGFNAFAWDEQQNVTMSVFVDETQNPGGNVSPIPGTITGTFASHFIHFDGIPGVIGATGTVIYNQPIVGVIFQPLSLDNTDGPLGAGSTFYPTTYAFRGLNTSPPSFCTVVGNTISFNLNALAPTVDIAQIRVLTHVPAPGAAAVLGMSGLLVARRRRAA